MSTNSLHKKTLYIVKHYLDNEPDKMYKTLANNLQEAIEEIALRYNINIKDLSGCKNYDDKEYEKLKASTRKNYRYKSSS